MPLTRILIVAENASTRLGGEAILPCHYFRLLRARGLDAHLIVHERVRAELEQHFPHDLDHLHFVSDQTLQKLFYKAGRALPRRIDEATLGLANQLLTQRAQRAVVRHLLVPGTVLHQPIPVSPRFPSVMAGLGAPLVVGPLNGGMEYPATFGGAESVLTRALIALGRSFTDAMNAVFSGKRNAALVRVANARTCAALPSKLKGRIVELVENGVDLTQWSASSAAGTDRFVFIGRLVDWKTLDVALEALAQIPGAKLDVIGDGPMRAPWEARAAELGAQADFHGWKSQAECASMLAGSTALLLPSVYECGGAVVLEAMAAAVPVIATAWGGPLDYLDPTCGFLVAPDSREQLVAGFSVAMATLAANAELRARMGAAGRARVVAHFSWEHKVDLMLGLYASVL
jgi:glycosyltransferase involved in cell wall biosynthesis